ncbi:MAG: hypothetical protein KDK05_01350 [Candidatus Competibacteraceae bacterium]|nr:hypothetical protein [Candidatus Competibacteraceae bacterium]MCB1808357.1 hypothetical protein [Candidatus Competibacteraceae bacterium]
MRSKRLFLAGLVIGILLAASASFGLMAYFSNLAEEHFNNTAVSALH